MRKYLIIVVNLLSTLPIGGDFFKTLLASAAIGDGSIAIKNKDYQAAFKILERFEKYEINDIWVGNCQYMLGTLYLNGFGTEKNEEKANSLFQLAASAGSNDAIQFMRRKNAKERKLHSSKTN